MYLFSKETVLSHFMKIATAHFNGLDLESCLVQDLFDPLEFVRNLDKKSFG